MFSSEKIKIESDIKRWNRDDLRKYPLSRKAHIGLFIRLLSFKPEYRNVFLNRIRKDHPILFHFCNVLSPRLNTLYIPCSDIGSGLFIEHGFSTIIAAEKIGNNCDIYQQVTIGYCSKGKAPKIGNNVIIYPGSKLFGDITINDNSVIGANAVVTKDVPENCTVIGAPAYIIRIHGNKVVRSL